MIFLLLLLSYLLGSVPTGLLLAKGAGMDIRRHGSGNIGATNVNRALGKAMGALTLAGDAAKAVLPMLAVGWYFRDAGDRELWVGLAGGAAFLGHIFPVYLKFRGGKGVATALGVFLVISPLTILASLAVFVLVVARSGYVSLGSLTTAALLPLWVWLIEPSPVALGLAIFIGALIWVKHRENLARLIHHQEKSWKKAGGANDADMPLAQKGGGQKRHEA